MRTAIETMTDCVATITNYKKDGTKFINQSSLFVIFQTASDCPHTKMATAQLLCVHADVTGLGPEVCKQVEDDATVLKGVVQQALQDGTLDVNKDGGVGLSGKHTRMRSHAHNHTQREIVRERGAVVSGGHLLTVRARLAVGCCACCGVHGSTDKGTMLLVKYQKKVEVLAMQKDKRKLFRGLNRETGMMKAVDFESMAKENRSALLGL